ncbi:hypothetical protein KP509_02G005700 [Ceratopteris richardii]|nr:hypothetical protein KP509_02G005700 [Ceratopteris richardii]
MVQKLYHNHSNYDLSYGYRCRPFSLLSGTDLNVTRSTARKMMIRSPQARMHPHSLASSSHLYGIKARRSYPSHVRRISHHGFAAVNPCDVEAPTKKKRSSLWSMFRFGLKGKKRGLHEPDVNGPTVVRGDYPGRFKESYGGASSHMAGQNVRRAFDADCMDQDFLYRNGFVSPGICSPRFMPSPSTLHSSPYLFPSPIAKQNPMDFYQWDRNWEGESASPLQTEFSQEEEDAARASWGFSMLPKRIRRTKSASATEDMVFWRQTYVDSPCISSDATPSGSKNQSPFFPDDSYHFAYRDGRNGLQVLNRNESGELTSPFPERHGHGYRDEIHQNLEADDIDSRKRNREPFHRCFGDHSSCVEEHLQHPAANSSSSIKSPRSVVPEFLRKKTRTLSIDCGRDVRVSPVPMLKIRRCEATRQQDTAKVNKQSSAHRGMRPQSSDDDFKTKQKQHRCLVAKNMSIVTKENHKHFKLKSLLAVKHLLKSPEPSMKRVNRRGVHEEGRCHQDSTLKTSSWSKVFRKTLSPVLGQMRQTKHSMTNPYSFYTGYIMHAPQYYTSCDDSHSQDESAFYQSISDSDGTKSDYHDEISGTRKLYGHAKFFVSSPVNDIFTRPTHTLSGIGDKASPPHYSFLSKDYSAFSYYFSPEQMKQHR